MCSWLRLSLVEYCQLPIAGPDVRSGGMTLPLTLSDSTSTDRAEFGGQWRTFSPGCLEATTQYSVDCWCPDSQGLGARVRC